MPVSARRTRVRNELDKAREAFRCEMYYTVHEQEKRNATPYNDVYKPFRFGLRRPPTTTRP